jgi:hypothetical protein
MHPKFSRRAVAAAVLLFSAACDRKDGAGLAPEESPDGAQVSPAVVVTSTGGLRMAIGDTVTLTPRRSISRARVVRWSSSDDAVVTVNSSGLIRARSLGSARVTVNSSAGSETTAITVAQTTLAAPSVSSVEVSSSASSLTVGSQLALTAIARDANLNVLSGKTATWTRLSGTAAVLSPSGVLTAASVGAVTVRATVEGVAGERTYIVTAPVQDAPAATLSKIEIAPRPNVRIAPRATQQFQASAVWSNGSRSTPSVTWSATRGTITSSGLYTASGTEGSYQVIARSTSGNLADTVSVDVTSSTAVMTSFRISPDGGPALAPGATRQYTHTITWSDGATRPVNISYSTLGGTITSTGLFTAGQVAGSFLVIANCGCGRPDTVEVEVSQVSSQLVSLTLNPASATMMAGTTRQFSTSALWSTGATTVPPVTYSATGGSISQTGLYTAPATPGVYRVIVAQTGGSVRDTSEVTVQAAAVTLSSLTMTPPSVTLNAGQTQQFSVAGSWSNGTSSAPPVTYSATGGTISATGLYTAPSTAGTYRVIAAHTGGTLRDTSDITVQAAPLTLTSLTINPASVTVSAGQTQQFAVAGTWSNGSSSTPSHTYSATGGTVSAGGLYTAPSTAGTYLVIAAHSGGTLRDTSVVTVQAGVTAPPPPPPSGGFAQNLPSGMRLVAESSFENYVDGSRDADGIEVINWTNNTTENASTFGARGVACSGGYGTRCFRTWFPGNHAGEGVGPSTLLVSGLNSRAHYMVVRMRYSPGYVLHSNGEKLFYPVGPQLPSGGNGAAYAASMNVSGGGHILGYDAPIETQPLMGPLSSANVIPIGRWFTAEFFAEMNTPGQSNGTLQVWIDGVRVVNKTGIMLSNSQTQQLFDRGRRDFTRGGGPSSVLTPAAGQWVEMDRIAFYAR